MWGSNNASQPSTRHSPWLLCPPPRLPPAAQIDIHFTHAMGAMDGVENGSGGRGGSVQAGRGVAGGGHFVVEVCTSQEDDRWKEVSARRGAAFRSGEESWGDQILTIAKFK